MDEPKFSARQSNQDYLQMYMNNYSDTQLQQKSIKTNIKKQGLKQELLKEITNFKQLAQIDNERYRINKLFTLGLYFYLRESYDSTSHQVFQKQELKKFNKESQYLKLLLDEETDKTYQDLFLFGFEKAINTTISKILKDTSYDNLSYDELKGRIQSFLLLDRKIMDKTQSILLISIRVSYMLSEYLQQGLLNKENNNFENKSTQNYNKTQEDNLSDQQNQSTFSTYESNNYMSDNWEDIESQVYKNFSLHAPQLEKFKDSFHICSSVILVYILTCLIIQSSEQSLYQDNYSLEKKISQFILNNRNDIITECQQKFQQMNQQQSNKACIRNCDACVIF